MGFPRVAKRYAPAETATGITDDLIVNADVNSAAAIATTKINFGSCTAASADLKLIAASGKDVFVKLSDAAGARVFIVQDSAAATQFSIDSDGNILAVGTLTMPTSKAIVADTFSGIGGKDTTVSMITAGDDFIINLKAANVADVFRIQGNGADKLAVGGTGIITMAGGTTLDNTTSAAELNITETAVKVTGNFTVTGTSLQTGVATHTATSVFTGGLDTKRVTHTGVAIADITAAMGDPATLGDGFLGTYKNSTDGKIYLVTVDTGAFFIVELAAAAA